MLWLLQNNCDFESAGKTGLIIRTPFLEYAKLFIVGQVSSHVLILIFLMVGFPRMPYLSSHMQAMKDMFMNVDKVEQLPSPRVIRPHLPFYLLPPQLLDTAKVVYVARNPKDVIVSYYFHHKLIKLHGYIGTLEEFAQFFMDDEGMLEQCHVILIFPRSK